jgi:phenylpropionate dioxygenase-like ring-hydroxylating dioxygenase large terminal subunit
VFLRNAWYAATWSKDLTDKPLGRTFLNEKVVLFRQAGGAVAALEDRCCHRAAPLSLGEVDGEYLVCGYHGLRFDATGRCVEVPGQKSIPRGAAVRHYPVFEKWNVVWIWMGDPARADPVHIPELPWLQSAQWAISPGYIHMKAHYQLIIENLLDLTHIRYVHKTTLSGDAREATTPSTVERLSDGVRNSRWMLDVVPNPLFKRAGNFEGSVDRWQIATWRAPAVVYLDIGSARAGSGAPEGNRSQGISIWSNHLIVPETENTTHYHFCYARNFALDDAEIGRLMYEGSYAAFQEDTRIIEASQTNRNGAAPEGLVDIIADAAQLQARRMLNALIAAEQPR